MPTIDSIKATFVGCESIKAHFSSNHCLILISVGKIQHENANLRSMIALINSRFGRCTIAVCDSLQRYNLNTRAGAPSKELHDIANACGDDWIKRNEIALSEFDMPVLIKRWDGWLYHRKFYECERIVKEAYSENNRFRNAVHNTIDEFTSRMGRKDETVSFNIIQANCLGYLLEEIAVMMLMMPEEGYRFVAYPNKIIEALKVAHEIFLSSENINLMNWVHVQLKKKAKKNNLMALETTV